MLFSGAIVLFSGLGDIKTAQEQLSVGVGALAGSTIMLLTVVWALCIIAGRVNIDSTGNCVYTPTAGQSSKYAPIFMTKIELTLNLNLIPIPGTPRVRTQACSPRKRWPSRARS